MDARRPPGRLPSAIHRHGRLLPGREERPSDALGHPTKGFCLAQVTNKQASFFVEISRETSRKSRILSRNRWDRMTDKFRSSKLGPWKTH